MYWFLKLHLHTNHTRINSNIRNLKYDIQYTYIRITVFKTETAFFLSVPFVLICIDHWRCDVGAGVMRRTDDCTLAHMLTPHPHILLHNSLTTARMNQCEWEDDIPKMLSHNFRPYATAISIKIVCLLWDISFLLAMTHTDIDLTNWSWVHNNIMINA